MERPINNLPEETDKVASQEYDIEKSLNQFEALVVNAPLVSPTDRSRAPFRDYSENTRERWQYIQADEVDEYLRKKFFFDVNNIPFEDKISVGEIDISDTNSHIQVPLDLFVYAAGFKDWRGRGEDTGKTWISEFGIGHDSKSIDAIKHYTGLSTKLPGVGRVNMYRQPDGKVYFSNSSGDSHRISAAILRGCEFIETSRVSMYDVQKNYI
jgi:hypothetical protein